jgi:hypothetical protein
MPPVDRVPCRFAAKEDPAGFHAIVLEPVGESLSALAYLHGVLTFELRAGLTIHEARALARMLNERVDALGCRSVSVGRPAAGAADHGLGRECTITE